MRSTNPLKKALGIGALACLSLAAGASAQSATTDPVGFITLNVAGTNGTAASALSFVGLGLTQAPSFRGNLEGVSGATVTDSQATWADNAYNGAAGAYYLELTSGTGAGQISQITATNAAAKSLTLANDLSGYISAGVTYTVRKNWTLATVFPVGASGLTGGSSTSADQVLVYNTQTQQYTSYYYKTTSFPPNSGQGWRLSTDQFTDQGPAPFNPYDGILVRRYQSAAVPLTLTGAVKIGQTSLPVAVGLNILSNEYPGGTFTLGTSGLKTASNATGVAGGSSTSADQVLLYDAASGTYTSYYYKTTTFPPNSGQGWRSATDQFTPADGVVLPVGGSILVQRLAANGGPFQWVAPQPFTLNP